MHSRRALLYVPGNDRHKIEKAITLGVDSICLDMEDGVARNRKEEARRGIAAALAELSFGSAERLTRINPVGSGWEMDDLAAVLPCHPEGIVIPKVEAPEHVQRISERIEAAELANGWGVNSVRILIGIETAPALLDLKAIAAHPRLEGLIFGGEDYAASIGAIRSESAEELFTARSLVVMHARAFGLQAIDMVTIDYHDLERLRQEADLGFRLGYTGKQVIHPAQVAPVQEAFTPNDGAIGKAKELIAAFEEHQREGHGAFGWNGQMVDLPLYKAAQQVLERARAAGKG